MTGIVRYVIEEICDRYVIEEMYEIVFSSGFYDVGLCIEKNRDGTPRRVMGRADKYHPDGASYYGGVEMIRWVRSGKYVDKNMWICGTNQHMSTQDVADAFGIDLNKLHRKYQKKETIEETKLRRQYTDNMFDTIKNELIETFIKGLFIDAPDVVYGYKKGVTDTLKVIKNIVEKCQEDSDKTRI